MHKPLLYPLLLGICFVGGAWANPEPEIPVHIAFQKDGNCTVTVEVDPRCFTADPMHERYLMKVDLGYRSPEDLSALKARAADAVKRWISFQGEPQWPLKPVFEFEFTGIRRKPLEKADDPVVLTGSWTFQVMARMKGLRVHATQDAAYAVVVGYSVKGAEQERTATLFAGETSFDLMKRAASTK